MDDIRHNKRKPLSSDELERLVLRLPVLLYRLIDGTDFAALEADVIKTANRHVYATHYGNASGTIKDKEAEAELKSAEESTIVDLAKRVHNRLKSRADIAHDMLDAIKKAMTSRDVEKQTFRKDRNV